MPYGLSPQQWLTARVAVNTARRGGANHREILSLLEAGLVEKNLIHTPGGDSDSQGFLQQRPSQGWGPFIPGRRGIRVDTRQYIDRAEALRGRGLTAGQLAQAVQRSQFPSRYGERRGEALSILRRLNGAGVGGGGGGGGAPRVRRGVPGARGGPSGAFGALPPTSAPGGLPMGSSGIVPLLQALQKAQRPVGGSMLQAPSFAAQPTLAGGGQVSSSGPPVPKVATVALLDAIRTAGGDVPGLAPAGAPSGVQGPGASAVGRSAVQNGGLPKSAKGDHKLAAIISEANFIDKARVPYLWGGGHAGRQIRGTKVTPLDCSGAVSRVLGLNPRVSGQFEGWGAPGRGRHVTVYANGHHVLMEVNGRFWGTSASNPGGGAGWIDGGVISKDYLRSFVARHPRGL